MKPKILLTTLTAAALACAAVSAGHATATTAGDVAYLLQFQGPTGLVDVPPKAKGGILRDPRPGDTLIARSRVLDSAGKRAGRTSELCTMTVRRPVTYDCSMALDINDAGQLLVHGAINPMHTPWTAPVTGGTGRYAGARGTVHVTDAAGNTPTERWNFSLTP
jgi:hypothetical protein